MLEQYLFRCDAQRLEAIARRRGFDMPDGDARQVAGQLAAQLLDPAEIALLRKELSQDEQAALKDLLAAGGSLPWMVFARRWGEVRVMGPARMERERPWEQPASAAEWLWYRGLVYRDTVEGSTGLEEIAVVPEEMRGLLPKPSAASLTVATRCSSRMR